MRRVGTRTKLAVFATAAVALTSGILFPSLASAGTNGQQIDLCNWTAFGSASITGNNQDGVLTTLSDVRFNPMECTPVFDWWWAGEVTIDYTTDADPVTGVPSRTGSTTCVIPQDNGAPPDTLASIVKCTIG